MIWKADAEEQTLLSKDNRGYMQCKTELQLCKTELLGSGLVSVLSALSLALHNC